MSDTTVAREDEDDEKTWRAFSKRPAGRVVMAVGWPACAVLLFAGYRDLLSAAGLSGGSLTAASALSVPFVIFLTTGAWTWCLGVVVAARRRLPDALRWPAEGFAADLTTVTAVVFPIKNENTAQVFANVATIREALREVEAEHLFEFYIVSNSDDANCWAEEELLWQTAFRDEGQVHYWRRHRKEGRKPANIAEFCERWGARHTYMVVMDADSLMSADCLLTLVGLMEHNPRSALMQTLTEIVNGKTLFARLQQFSGWNDNRIVAWGERVWQGAGGTYYGHNAIIRIAPFMAHCGLPRLSGRPPFGGDVLSHDYVEAALLRRAGWDVWLMPEVAGSYEECPTTLEEFFQRDRRWCQGDVLNLRLLAAPQLSLTGRIRFVLTALRDLSAPILLTLVGVIVASSHSPALATAAIATASLVWDFSYRMSWAGVPAFGLGISLYAGTARQTDLPLLRSFCNGLLMHALWTLAVPVRVLVYARFALQIACRRAVGWSTMRRAGTSSTLRHRLRLYWPHVLTGTAVSLLLWCTGSWALWWLSPLLIGWIVAVPLTLVFDSRRVGTLARRAGVLLTPEEHAPPPLVSRAHEIAGVLRAELPREPWLAALTEPSAMAVHDAFLAHQPPLTGQDRAAASAAAAKYRAGSLLTTAERLALLRDPYQLWPDAPSGTRAIPYPAAVPTTMPEQRLTPTC